jgi:hypothetical protein
VERIFRTMTKSGWAVCVCPPPFLSQPPPPPRRCHTLALSLSLSLFPLPSYTPFTRNTPEQAHSIDAATRVPPPLLLFLLPPPPPSSP